MARQVLDNGVILPSEYSDDWYDDMTSNLTKLDEVIGSNAEKLSASDVGETAISNDYDDLDDKPAYNILRRASVTLTAGGTGNYSDLDSDSKIKAGDYVLDAANKLYSITAIDAANSTYTVSAAALFTVTDKAELGAAALSNDYDDLNNLPGYGILRFCSTAITDNSSVPFANISSVSKIAAGDFLLDTAAKLYTVSAVDTSNQTAAVTTPLTQLAVDSLVVHNSGNETISGKKTFSDDLTIYNYNSSQATKNLTISSSKISVGDTSNSDSFGIVFNAGLSYVSRITAFKDTSGTQNLQFGVRTKDSSNNLIGAMIRLRSYANGFNSFESDGDNLVSLGSSSNKWKNVNTYQVNGVEPSSLSLPSGNVNDVIDISGYITYLDGSVNTYTAPANGWIAITMNNCSGIQGYINGLWGNQVVRPSAGVVRFLMPITKNLTANILIFGGTIDNARFIPCQGNF